MQYALAIGIKGVARKEKMTVSLLSLYEPLTI
jgi:hypothetical protein